MKKKRINVITLGCSKNLVDSEVILRQLVAAGHEVIYDSNEPSDIIIINTCGFIADAKQESIDTILQAIAMKDAGQIEAVYVGGCLSQRYRDDLRHEMPEVDAWFGVDELEGLLSTLHVDLRKELIGERLLTTPPHYAYLKIAEGCDRSCSFCAIPKIRGKHISTPMEDILKEAQYLVKNGVKEILLISQDLTWYGIDIYGKQMLPELVELLSKESGAEWIRLHYTFPTSFPTPLLDMINKYENVCNYIDIPLQHINDRLLKSMNRGIGREGTLKLIEAFRTALPDAAIRTSFIVGYPGETEEEFEELRQFVADMRFDRVGVFTYSHEEDTPAESLDDDVPEEVKSDRAATIMELQESISYEKNQLKIGKTFRVLIDRHDEGQYVGRTEFDSPEVDNEVVIEHFDKPLQCGEFYTVLIEDAEAFDLIGRVIA